MVRCRLWLVQLSLKEGGVRRLWWKRTWWYGGVELKVNRLYSRNDIIVRDYVRNQAVAVPRLLPESNYKRSSIVELACTILEIFKEGQNKLFRSNKLNSTSKFSRKCAATATSTSNSYHFQSWLTELDINSLCWCESAKLLFWWAHCNCDFDELFASSQAVVLRIPGSGHYSDNIATTTADDSETWCDSAESNTNYQAKGRHHVSNTKALYCETYSCVGITVISLTQRQESRQQNAFI